MVSNLNKWFAVSVLDAYNQQSPWSCIFLPDSFLVIFLGGVRGVNLGEGFVFGEGVLGVNLGDGFDRGNGDLGIKLGDDDLLKEGDFESLSINILY